MSVNLLRMNAYKAKQGATTGEKMKFELGSHLSPCNGPQPFSSHLTPLHLRVSDLVHSVAATAAPERHSRCHVMSSSFFQDLQDFPQKSLEHLDPLWLASKITHAQACVV